MNPKLLRETLDKIAPVAEARGRNTSIRVGDTVEGIQGVDGGKTGTVTKIGGPFSSSGAATVYVSGENGEWDTYDFNVKKVGQVAEGESDDRAAQLEHELESMEDGLNEFRSIQEELLMLKERLADAIRGYMPDSYQYWRSYGLGQLDIIAGGDEYMSRDESINSLIEDLESQMQETRDELESLGASREEIEDDVDMGQPVYTRKERF